MKKFFTLFLTLLLLVFWGNQLVAQCNGAPCGGPPQPFVNAQDACVLPAPSSLDCYFGSTTFDPPVSLPPSWCTSVENNHFFAFTADAATATFEICTYGCGQGSGIQAAVLSTADCINFQFVSPCLGNIGSNTCQNLVANGLVPGEVYYLMIDGNAGAVCDYSINGVNPTISGPSSGVCLPSAGISTYTTNTVSTWTINPPSAGNILGNPISTTASVQWLAPGPAEVCAQSLTCPNAPNLCIEIEIGEDVMSEETVEVCQGRTVVCAGRTFSTGGTFPVALDSYLGCDSVVNCIVNVIPTVTSTQVVRMCPFGTVSCAGEEFFAPGTYPVTLQTERGCDSIVRCVVSLITVPNMPMQNINLCGPNQVDVCQGTDILTESGLYAIVCTGFLGCDSIVNINLAIMEPEAVIAPPAILDCGANLIVTLDGTGSNINMANGGSTTYRWTGTGIVGFNNQPTVQVNQPGEYCLILTHGRGGVACSDTTCVTVLQDAGIPQLPVLTGFQTPCAGMTLVYSATATGNPPPTSFNWTLPGNHPFTVLTPSSIEVTWLQGTPTGQLCVTANNSCGASPPACIPISVGDQPIPPVPLGPSSVCTAGGDYLFTLDSFQMGTQYLWTVPPGAVLTGSGDSVLINFANAVSGQVCVTAQNACDTLPPVCLNVTVVPNPTGDLSGLSEICLGDSLILTFTLAGNGPFDVLWSNGAQNFQQSGPGNVYTATVFPTVNTTYTLISIRDNSMPACETQILDTLQVTVWPLDTTNQTIEICAGESVLLGGAQQNMSGIYRDTLSNINGCDSIIVSTLIVNPIDTTLIALTTCDPAEVGTVTVILPQANGCDSVVVTNTILLPSDLTEIFDNSCDIANVGVFTQNLLNQFGCDSTVITTISFSESDTTYVSETTCLPSEVGTFEELLVSVTDGCDSLIVTTVTLLPSNTTASTGTSCNPSEVGVFVQNLTNMFGCDSIVTTTISFVPLPPTPLTATTCNPSETGIFMDTLLTANGCDSILVTTVSLLPSSATSLTGTSCNLSEVGVFVQNLTNQFGCDSIVTTTISFIPLPPTPLSATTCNASEAGVFTDTIVTAAGCDSLLVTTVTFIPLPPTPLTATTCNPSETGIFMDTLLTADGCDSILITTVSLLPSSATSLSGTSCNLSEVGVFVQNLTNQFGCDSIVTTTISFIPLPPTPFTTTTCDPAAAGVFNEIIVTADGCDSLVVTTVTLLPSNLTELAGSDCNPANVGVFTQDLTNQFGCDSTVITTVALLPSSTTAIASTTCFPSEVGVFVFPLVNQFGCDSIVTETVTLLPSSATTVNVGTCEPNEVGSAITVLTNQFGCDSTVTTVTSLLPPASCGMTAILSGSTIPCGITTGTLTLTVTLGEGPFNYTVLLGGTPVANGTIASVGIAQTVSGLAAGNYTVNYTSANGFSTLAQATIIQLFPPVLNVSAASNYGGFGVSCPGATDGSVLGAATGGLPPYNFVWSNGAATPQTSNLGVGTYTVTVTDANSCTATGTAFLSEPAPLDITFSVNNPRCFGNSNGSIVVTAAGGIQPYRYSLNGGAPQTGNVFAGLDAGSYTITAFDQSECETSEIILVNTPIELIVDLGPDINIELGETANLQAIVNVPFDSLAAVIWTPIPNPECPGCLEHTVFPLISTTYSIEVIDVNGCRDQDNVVVIVDRRKHVYIPNIFSPNDDGDNDIFSIFARPGTVRNIRSLMVFDRWGEQLYINENFSPNDGNIGWNGIYKGQPMNPGVFVWVVEIEFIDGVVELYKGDVTLMR